MGNPWLAAKKRCLVCGISKSLNEFHRKSSSRDGHREACKPCHCEEVREYRRRNPDKVDSANRRWREANPEKARAIARRGSRRYYWRNLEKSREAHRRWLRKNPDLVQLQYREWVKKNRERRREIDRRFYERHRDERKDHVRKWQKQNRDKVKGYRYERRAKIRGNPSDKVNPADIYERDKGICHLCKRKVSRKTFTLDHLIPLSDGGPHTASNVAIAHHRCNCRRSNGRLPAQLRLVG